MSKPKPCLRMRIKIIAFVVAVLFAVVPATLYFLHEVQHIRDISLQYSQLLGERLQQAVAENQMLWQYSVPKFVEIDRHRQLFPDIIDVAVYDRDFRLIHAEASRKSDTILAIPIQYKFFSHGEHYGFIQVVSQLEAVALWTAIFFLFGGAIGGALGYGICFCSNRMMQDAERSTHELLQDMEIHDAATGVYTIAYVGKYLTHLFAKPEKLVSVLLIDIDFFRNYNELHGHEQGNRVLLEVSQLLRRYLREQDIAGRFGGEEFIVVLPETAIKDAIILANQIRCAVESGIFTGAEYQPQGSLTVSIGVASSESAATCQELFRHLDEAIYKAKSAGRNYVYAFSAAGPVTKTVDYSSQSPGMKAEVTRKFIDRFFYGSEQSLSQLHEPTIRAFLKALEIWDPGTVQHSLRVNRIAMEIARAMDLPKADSLILNLGTLLHDIGKLTIGDTILAKPGPLTEAEYELMKNHPQIGFDLIKDDPALRKAADIIVMHHERFDGTGYPLKLAGKQIPLLARICAVADAMDAMLTDRPYSKGKTVEEVRREIHRNKGGQFDPEIVDVVLAVDWNVFHHLSAMSWGQLASVQEQA